MFACWGQYKVRRGEAIQISSVIKIYSFFVKFQRSFFASSLLVYSHILSLGRTMFPGKCPNRLGAEHVVQKPTWYPAYSVFARSARVSEHWKLPVIWSMQSYAWLNIVVTAEGTQSSSFLNTKWAFQIRTPFETLSEWSLNVALPEPFEADQKWPITHKQWVQQVKTPQWKSWHAFENSLVHVYIGSLATLAELAKVFCCYPAMECYCNDACRLRFTEGISYLF